MRISIVIKQLNITLLVLSTFLYQSCINPIAPEYNFVDDQLVIEGFASSAPGTSFVNVNQTNSEFGIYRNIFQEGAIVTFNNLDTGESIILQEKTDTYVPPEDFAVVVGSSWVLNITLVDGRKYKSLPETVIEPIAISEIQTNYEKELIFREDSGKFVPGHSLLVSFEDPPNKKNYYFWRFRSFEKQIFCEICSGANFRDGVCKPDTSGSFRPPYFSYYCEKNCWRIRFNENIEIFEDEFSDGTAINLLPVGNVLLYSNENILVEVQQLSLSFDAYRYYKRLKDVVDNNGNFDAPPPSAVVGNIFNPNDDDEIILGRFTAASTSNASIFIERDEIMDDRIEIVPDPILETDPPFSPNITTAPCNESRTRTAIRPEGWIGN